MPGNGCKITAKRVTHFAVTLFCLDLLHPETVDIAVLIYGNRPRGSYTDNRFRLILQINSDAAMLCLDIYKHDMVLRRHRMGRTAYIDLYPAVVQPRNNRDMLFAAGVYSVRGEFLHLFATAYNRNL